MSPLAAPGEHSPPGGSGKTRTWEGPGGPYHQAVNPPRPSRPRRHDCAAAEIRYRLFRCDGSSVMGATSRTCRRARQSPAVSFRVPRPTGHAEARNCGISARRDRPWDTRFFAGGLRMTPAPCHSTSYDPSVAKRGNRLMTPDVPRTTHGSSRRLAVWPPLPHLSLRTGPANSRRGRVAPGGAGCRGPGCETPRAGGS
jgi:hypothetical protein